MNFLMVIMASGIVRGRVRSTTTTTESRKMAAIIQIIAWQRHAALVYCVLLWYWASTLWSIDTCQNKVSADPYDVTISRAQVYSSSRSRVFWSWLLTKCWFSIRSRAHVWFTCRKQRRIVRKAVNTNPGLKVKNELLKLRTEGQTIYDSLRRRACARNVSFRISLRWLIHIINSVDKTKLS